MIVVCMEGGKTLQKSPLTAWKIYKHGLLKGIEMIERYGLPYLLCIWGTTACVLKLSQEMSVN